MKMCSEITEMHITKNNTFYKISLTTGKRLSGTFELAVCHFCGDVFFKRRRKREGGYSYCSRKCCGECPDRKERWRKNVLPKFLKQVRISIAKRKNQRREEWKSEGKRCSQCDKIKPLTEFYKRSNGYFLGECKQCAFIITQRWRKNNVEKVREGDRIRSNFKRKNDPIVRLNHYIGCAIRKRIHKKMSHSHWEDLLGYSIEQLKKHLERQFKFGMTWKNWGQYGWQIDHIIPLNAFNFKTEYDIDFKRAWALTNLQPLWATENNKKGAKLDKPFQPSLAFAVNQ